MEQRMKSESDRMVPLPGQEGSVMLSSWESRNVTSTAGVQVAAVSSAEMALPRSDSAAQAPLAEFGPTTGLPSQFETQAPLSQPISAQASGQIMMSTEARQDPVANQTATASPVAPLHKPGLSTTQSGGGKGMGKRPGKAQSTKVSKSKDALTLDPEGVVSITKGKKKGRPASINNKAVVVPSKRGPSIPSSSRGSAAKRAKTTAAVHPTTEEMVIEDDYPNRLVNPLIGVFPPSLNPHHHLYHHMQGIVPMTLWNATTSASSMSASDQPGENSSVAAAATATTSNTTPVRRKSNVAIGASSSGKGPSSGKAGISAESPVLLASPTSTRCPVVQQDWVSLLDLWFPPPDTYSIAYQARLLGFDLSRLSSPTISLSPSVGVDVQEDGRKSSTVGSGAKHWVDTLPLLRPVDSSAIATASIPEYWRHWVEGTWKSSVRLPSCHRRDTLLDKDDIRHLDMVDPLYRALWRYFRNRTGNQNSAPIDPSASDDKSSVAANWRGKDGSLLKAEIVHTRSLSAQQHLKLLHEPTLKALAQALLDAFQRVASPALKPLCSSILTLAEFQALHPIADLPTQWSRTITGWFTWSSLGGLPTGLILYDFCQYHLNVTAAEAAGMAAGDPSTLASPRSRQARGTPFLVVHLERLRDTKKNYLGPNSIGFQRRRRQTTASLDGMEPSKGENEGDGELLEAPVLLMVVLVSLAMEHARFCGVSYAVLPEVPLVMVPFFQTYFRMTVLPGKRNSSEGETAREHSEGVRNPGCETVSMICDLSKCSTKFAFLCFHERVPLVDVKSPSVVASDNEDKKPSEEVSFRERFVLQLPSACEVKRCIVPNAPVAEGISIAADAIGIEGSVPVKPVPDNRAASAKTVNDRQVIFSSADLASRKCAVRLRAKLSTSKDEAIDNATNSSYDVILHRLSSEGKESSLVSTPAAFAIDPGPLAIFRSVPLMSSQGSAPSSASQLDKESLEGDRLERDLLAKRRELEEIEGALEPQLRSLLLKVVHERLEYEGPAARQERERVRITLAEHATLLERRREIDLAFQMQLEQDMNAVCDVCDDGEVTPDNQILFCESCNVAVHQMCYGIERIPEGDYYCQACKHLGRNISTRNPDSGKILNGPLPICCELCPRRQGAFIRTAMEGHQSALDKWVHVVCAKWQGLTFVDPERADLVEDVTDLKVSFRQQHIQCSLCLGERGAMNRCRFTGCTSWIHVTCARTAGNCVVTHGEDCSGPVNENPWTLLCPTHSQLPDKPRAAAAIEKLVLAAKEFPPEPQPAPPAVVAKPFNTVGGKERDMLMADRSYERALLFELTMKKFFGMRCEVCDNVEEEGKNLTRCSGCAIVFCVTCKLGPDNFESSNYKCPACAFVDAKRKANEDFEEPKCIACNQKGGLLRECFAKPVNRRSFWSSNLKELQKSWFSKQLWMHELCAFWHSQGPHMMDLDLKSGKVDCSNAVMSSGRGFVRGHVPCILCGQTEGLKATCSHEECRSKGAKSLGYFHVTCARQAGLEVDAKDNDKGSTEFYVRCYRHGGNNYNLRARLEDMIEIEKRRAGKTFAKAQSPMTFAHASRILNAGIHVMKVMGWAWRWAEWWVDYNSTWEPLLEEGEREEDMTKEQLKIVESTRASRASDARKCRLAALGAALRNRCYDSEDDFDRTALDRALGAVLSTKSLVGPLAPFEIRFFVDWLSRAYRTRSKLLGFGEDRIMIANEDFCKHMKDQQPKYELGERQIPGKQELSEGEIFESGIEECDDFLLTEIADKEPGTDPIQKQVLPTRSARKQADVIVPVELNSSSKRSSDATMDVGDVGESVVDEVVLASSARKKRGRPSRKDPDVVEHARLTTCRSPEQRATRSTRTVDSSEPPKVELSTPRTRLTQKPALEGDKTQRPLTTAVAATLETPKRRRGRPPKKKLPEGTPHTPVHVDPSVPRTNPNAGQRIVTEVERISKTNVVVREDRGKESFVGERIVPGEPEEMETGVKQSLNKPADQQTESSTDAGAAAVDTKVREELDYRPIAFPSREQTDEPIERVKDFGRDGVGIQTTEKKANGVDRSSLGNQLESVALGKEDKVLLRAAVVEETKEICGLVVPSKLQETARLSEPKEIDAPFTPVAIAAVEETPTKSIGHRSAPLLESTMRELRASRSRQARIDDEDHIPLIQLAVTRRKRENEEQEATRSGQVDSWNSPTAMISGKGQSKAGPSTTEMDEKPSQRLTRSMVQHAATTDSEKRTTEGNVAVDELDKDEAGDETPQKRGRRRGKAEAARQLTRL